MGNSYYWPCDLAGGDEASSSDPNAALVFAISVTAKFRLVEKEK